MSDPTLPKPIYLPPIVKGKSDYRTYRPLLLLPRNSNDDGNNNNNNTRPDDGLTVILVHDQNSKHFAASVSVASGASSDPRALPGLAHFCEHMCFLGSKTYPQENEYKQYLSQHGGKSNASTSASHTTYQFDVLAEFSEKALDIFSHFFIGPLFSMSGTEREVHAVDSENSKNLVNDGRRRWQILKDLGDASHHFSKFSTGNKMTLPAAAAAASSSDSGGDGNSGKSDGKVVMERDASTISQGDNSQAKSSSSEDDTIPITELDGILRSIGEGKFDDHDKANFVRAALLAFHKRHYRPNNMTVVVVGPQSLDELESWVVPRFGKIPDRWSSGDSSEGENDTANSNEDEDEVEKEKWKKMQMEAAKMVNEAAADAPPVSVEAAKTLEYRTAFRPELQGGKWPVVVTVFPLKSTRTLVLYFPLPPTWHVPDQSPTRILSHLFGHEGPGSPFALLQDAGLISSLSAGNRVSGPDQNLFQISVSLTEEGEEKWEEVVRVLFGYGRLLCRVAEEALESDGGEAKDRINDNDASECQWDPLRRIWDEVAILDRMGFDQTSPGQVYSFAPALAQSASKYGTTTCLSAGSLLNENGDTLPLKQLLDFCRMMIPENCFIERCSQNAWKKAEALYEGEDIDGINSTNGFSFGKQTEKWYGIDYFVSPVGDDDVRSWEGNNSDTQIVSLEALHLPEPNRYIPRSLELCLDLPEEAKNGPRIEKSIDPPKLLVNDPDVGRLWWRLDDRYALPKATLRLLIRTATSENKLSNDLNWEYDPETAMRSNFLTGIFANSLAQETYDADLAGLGWSLSKSSSGYTLTCSGYSDRLADLALKVLTDFCNIDGGDKTFLQETHFSTTKDRVVRGLQSFFESKRADSLAFYYRDLLLSYRSGGAEKNLEIAEGMTLEDVVEQHRSIWRDNNLALECLYSGNVSEKEAKDFFDQAKEIIQGTRTISQQKRSERSSWVPGPFERRLPSGEDIELHFSSKNPKEENGAVVVTYQSQKAGFKGKSLSSEESLRQSAAIRLISTMLREPLFNELRTKQQLGYIVSSYYDINFSSHAELENSQNTSCALSLTTPIDSIVLYVLSRKEKPTEVAKRIDDFLLTFRSRMEEMPPSEIQSYADSLADQLTKPIRKLGDEAGTHFAKIRRFAPETVCDSGHGIDALPWDNAEVLASTVRGLNRDEIIDVWDTLVVKKESRSRIVSYVYGKTFPMETPTKPRSIDISASSFRASSMVDLLSKRNSLIPYDPTTSYYNKEHFSWNIWGKHRTTIRYAAAAAAVVGVGLWGMTMMKGRDNAKKLAK